jgi:hypothetical protein
LYDALRPALIAVQSLDELCELVDILKHEVRRLCLTDVCCNLSMFMPGTV